MCALRMPTLLVWQVRPQPIPVIPAALTPPQGTWGRPLGKPVCDLPRDPRTLRQSPGPTHRFLRSIQEPHGDFINKPVLLGTALFFSVRSGILSVFLFIGIAHSMRSTCCYLQWFSRQVGFCLLELPASGFLRTVCGPILGVDIREGHKPCLCRRWTWTAVWKAL